MRWYALLAIAILLMGMGGGSGSAQVAPGVGAAAGEVRIPALQREQRSDWINVKTLGAKGDGVADDTDAIQKALDMTADSKDWLVCLRNRTVFLPAGRYRITRTVTWTHTTGSALLGQGRDTVLVWEGADDGTMFRSNGATYCRYEGLTWDGQGRAAVGVEHSSQTYYETSLRYQDCAFVRLRAHGMLNGAGREKNASAEFWFRNCLFRECGAGASFLNFNDYDNSFDGCEFIDCGIGVNSVRGNFYVRTSHFVRSKQVDVLQAAPSHASSIRLCTSQGSRRFFETGAGMHQPMKIQDCRVEGWTAPDGAIWLGHRGPTTIFDCVFTQPPNATPPIRLANPAGIQQLLIASNNTSAATQAIVDKGLNSRVTEVPAGKRRPVLTRADQRFLVDTAPAEGKLFDVVRDFGAKGDTATDDTDALQRAIDAARIAGNGAVVYLPAGQYKVTRTLRVTGKDYSIGGVGFRSIIAWAGPPEGEMMRVSNPQRLAVEHLVLQGPYETPRIHQTAAPGPSSIYYDEVYTNGCDYASTPTKGLWCDRLPAGAVVTIGDFIGNVYLEDCGPARILGALQYYSLWLYGNEQPQTGLTGFMFHCDAVHNYGIDVKDNQSLIIADFYTETNKRFLLAEGKRGQGPGRLTIGSSKMSTLDAEAITINDYEGRIFVGGGDSWVQSDMSKPLFWRHRGTRPVDFILAGQSFWALGPTMKVGPGMRYGSVENLLIHLHYPEYAEKSLPNVMAPTTQKALIGALDDFRELAAAYVQEFFPQAK